MEMKGASGLWGPRQEPASGGPAQQLVLLLHGLGADGNDLIGLAPVLAQVLPEAAFVSPHAPEACDMAPMGYQWFSLQSREPEALLAGVESARPALDAFIESQLDQYGLEESKLAVVGFSQGTMTALHVLPRRAKACACILGFSGMLVAPEKLASEIQSRPPVLLVHGEADEVVPISTLPAAEAGLKQAGIAVETLRRPGLGHGIDEEGLSRAAALLQRSLKP
ncbi:MAG: dienelactone hydrolase family protein [Rhodovibrionaceae bacterium]